MFPAAARWLVNNDITRKCLFWAGAVRLGASDDGRGARRCRCTRGRNARPAPLVRPPARAPATRRVLVIMLLIVATVRTGRRGGGNEIGECASPRVLFYHYKVATVVTF